MNDLTELLVAMFTQQGMRPEAGDVIDVGKPVDRIGVKEAKLFLRIRTRGWSLDQYEALVETQILNSQRRRYGLLLHSLVRQIDNFNLEDARDLTQRHQPGYVIGNRGDIHAGPIPVNLEGLVWDRQEFKLVMGVDLG